MNQTRREMFALGGMGLATLGVPGLLLRADAQVTPKSGGQADLRQLLAADAEAGLKLDGKVALTEDNILGPYFRSGAPFRGKVTPPLEPGTVMLIKGRVWSFETKRPLPGVVIDVWQANAKGRYDNDDSKNPPKKGVFVNRARLITDENGYYEYETIHPGKYLNGDDYRPAHIHYWVRAVGHKQLVTQLYFKGDTHLKKDRFVRESLIIDLAKEKVNGGEIEVGIFDIVLSLEKR